MNRYLLILLILVSTSVFGQEEKQESPFSHRGLKAAIGLGGFENEFGQTFEDGDGRILNLGYGIDDRFSLWLGAVLAEHPPQHDRVETTYFAGGEVDLQYKFITDSPWQPYGKVGVGIYAIQEDNSGLTFVGSGFTAALGLDYFFSRHFGIGAELQFKELDYSHRIENTPEGEQDTELRPQLDGQTTGFLITLTIQ